MRSLEAQHALGSVVCRKPRPSEGKDVHGLITDCPPLDVNSAYAYMILCAHFAETCVIAEEQDRAIGFLSAYKKPAEQDVLFVWQVAVGRSARGRGVGSAMLRELLARAGCSTVSTIETTIGPANRMSWALFESLAKKLGAATSRETYFQEEAFGDNGHEAEILFRIGPIDPEKRAKLCKSLNS